MNLLRSVFALVFGFLTVFVLAIATDVLLAAVLPSLFRHDGHTSDASVLVIALGYTTAFQTVGGYVAARLARRRPQLHALILGLLGLAAAIPLALAQWNHTPAWYHVATWVLTLPATWLGGLICARRNAPATAAAPA